MVSCTTFANIALRAPEIIKSRCKFHFVDKRLPEYCFVQ